MLFKIVVFDFDGSLAKTSVLKVFPALMDLLSMRKDLNTLLMFNYRVGVDAGYSYYSNLLSFLIIAIYFHLVADYSNLLSFIADYNNLLSFTCFQIYKNGPTFDLCYRFGPFVK